MVPPAGSIEQPATTTYERCVQTTGSGEKPHLWLENGKWHCVSGTPLNPIRARGHTAANAYRTWRLLTSVNQLRAGRHPQ